jgi:hypothetical protein
MTNWTVQLKKIGQDLANARTGERYWLENARVAAVEAIADGQTEVAVAELLGVDRMTVRKWVGKR